MGYYIKIHENNEKSCFQLWYNEKQEMGYSKDYDSREACKKGLKDFKNFIIENRIGEECEYLRIIDINSRSHIYQFTDINGQVLYTSRKIESRQSCANSMRSTCKNIIHAKIKEEI